ncbi:chorion class high-cysteine HCB protein 13-like [Brachypodium distachyon]|uniref:chorion class high-cysteine HCB protein 13-like n=1 Tax=Brachypodium distachyon TaxID=15368 RepID=UPI00052FF541|nr:chorion class high-cysteine HCB protein 13-like [Brachypodium distachyon]|eukprot:XP_010239027.1 chorion class high-cysteine HCB protein 13-like [Brachypodium distachyon]
MASLSAAKLLKATTLLAVVLAMLVLPTSARYRSRAPAPAPAPAGVIVRCSECPAYCAAAVAAAGLCGKYCDPPSSTSCDGCRSMVLQYCTACCVAGGGCSSSSSTAASGCGACNYCGGRGCAGEVQRACEQPQGACRVEDEGACKGCRAREEEHCNEYCKSNCVQ